MKYLRVIYIITFFCALVFYKLSFIDAIILAIDTIVMVSFSIKYRFINNIGRYLIPITIFISVVFMPTFRLLTYQSVSINEEYCHRVLSLGIRLLFVCSLILVLWLFFRKNIKEASRNTVYKYMPKRISKSTIYAVFIFIYALSFFSFSVGLGRMGADAVVLPFHFGGIINFLLRNLFPGFFTVYVEGLLLKKKNFPLKFLLLYIVWSFFMVLITLSKSILMWNLLPLLFVYYFICRPSMRTIRLVLIPLVALFLFMYPVVELMRNSGSVSADSFMAARTEANRSQDQTGVIVQALNRVFKTGAYYATDYDYLKDDTFFDFSRVNSLLVVGGAARYQTFIIDQYPEGVNHSSGSSGVMDALFHGGCGLAYIIIIVLSLAGGGIDRLYNLKMYSIFFFSLRWLFDWIANHNISCFYEPMGLQQIMVRVFLITMAYMINFRKKNVT